MKLYFITPDSMNISTDLVTYHEGVLCRTHVPVLTGPFTRLEASQLVRSTSIAQGPPLLLRGHRHPQHASVHSLSPIKANSTAVVQQLMIHRPGVWSARPALITWGISAAKNGCIAEIIC